MCGNPTSEETLQRRALAAYLSMAQQHNSWARRLVLLSASDEAAAFAMASLAAGAAVLWTCPDEATLRASGLAGLSDFQVTTLSEAIRILKNEIRKGLPVSVAVLDASGTVWAEAADRGLQPDAMLAGQGDAVVAALLLQRGAEPLEISAGSTIAERAASSWRELRSIDATLLNEVQSCDAAQRSIAERWLRAAPRLFPRELARCYVPRWTASKDSR